MISLNAFLTAIQSIVSERPTYRNGGSATDGTCDCIGLIIGAIRRAGGTWSGTHGSNYAARNMMQSYPPLEVGSIVYKARGPDDAGYSLPATYANHPDRLDYYHVGVVTSVNPLNITHCTSWSGGSGIKVDTVIGKWGYGGRIKGVDYEWGDKPVDTSPDGTIETEPLIVTVTGGGTARMRKKPDTDSIVFENIRDGTYVQGIGRGPDGWYQIKYNGKTGWMMEQYLRVDGETAPTDSDPPADREDMILVPKAKIQEMADCLQEMQGIIEDLLAMLRA